MAIRNIFDQYAQPENKLTHALACVLHEDRWLLKSFINTFIQPNSPDTNKLKVISQGLPGKPNFSDDEESSRGLPDAIIHNDDGFAIVIESKIESELIEDQLQRHIKIVVRCGFPTPIGVSITVSSIQSANGWKNITWQQIYEWSYQNHKTSEWGKRLMEYLNVAENKMVKEGYLKEGTITEFTGIPFGESYDFTYLEGKRVLKLLMNKLRQNPELEKLGLDLTHPGRAAITKGKALWDFIPFKSDNTNFTHAPHCTIGLGDDRMTAMITIPDKIKGDFKKKLKKLSFEQFHSLIKEITINIAKNIDFNEGCQPVIRIVQRHYTSQRSQPIEDGIMQFDLRTVLDQPNSTIKPQIEWLKSAFELLQNKNSNIQFQIGCMFFYDKCIKLKTKDCDHIFTKIWFAFNLLVRT